jgi:hypothetical protein
MCVYILSRLDDIYCHVRSDILYTNSFPKPPLCSHVNNVNSVSMLVAKSGTIALTATLSPDKTLLVPFLFNNLLSMHRQRN